MLDMYEYRADTMEDVLRVMKRWLELNPTAYISSLFILNGQRPSFKVYYRYDNDEIAF